MDYLLKKELEASDRLAIREGKDLFVSGVTREEWEEYREDYCFSNEMEIDFSEFNTSKAVSYEGCYLGTLSIPNRDNIKGDEHFFGFAVNKKGIVFIDDTGFADEILALIARNRKYPTPSIEKFIHDFLYHFSNDDIHHLEKYEYELGEMEYELVNKRRASSLRISEIRSELRKYIMHYDQLTDLLDDFMDNEDAVFRSQYLRYFHSYYDSLTRLRYTAESIVDHTLEVRDLRKEMIDMRQNKITTILTVVTTIFMPLTLITGWYGMNFEYMPEIHWRYSYPIVIAFSLALGISLIIYFKKKRWL